MKLVGASKDQFSLPHGVIGDRPGLPELLLFDILISNIIPSILEVEVEDILFLKFGMRRSRFSPV